MPSRDTAKKPAFPRILTASGASATAQCSRFNAASALHGSLFLDLDGNRPIFMNQAGRNVRDEGISMTQYWPFSGLMRQNALRERLIVSLDLRDRDDALRLVDGLARVVGMFKVGRALFVGGGPDFIREIRRRGAEVFLDLKFHDSPQKVLRPPSRRLGSASRCSTSIRTVGLRLDRDDVAHARRGRAHVPHRRPAPPEHPRDRDAGRDEAARIRAGARPAQPTASPRLRASRPTPRSTASSPGRMKFRACATHADGASSS